MAVGVPGSNVFGKGAGLLEVHRFDGDSWLPHGSLLGGYSNYGSLGYSISLSSNGSRVAGGEPYFSYNNEGKGGFNEAGMVRVYDAVDD